MRKTILHTTAIFVAGILLVASVGLGVLRNSGLTARNDQMSQAEQGALLFREMECSSCHATHSAENEFAPGLHGLFERAELPSSGRPVTEENVIAQLVNPLDVMPSYAGRLTGEEMDQVISFLKAL